MNLADLPDDVLTVLLAVLNVAELRLLPAVCRSWHLDSSRSLLWYGLAASRGVQMPRTTSKFSLRSKADLRQTFFAACRAQGAAQLMLFDRRCMAIVQAMKISDSVAALRREMAREPRLPVSHTIDPAARGGNATLLHAAARYGRVACTSFLLDQAAVHDHEKHANILEATDGGGATPLLVAAWCGHLQIVKLLLARGARIATVGIPPMTSSCGGRGPYDAETWARRKGFCDVAEAICAVKYGRSLVRE